MAKLQPPATRRLSGGSEPLAALVARRPGVLEDGDTLLSAIDLLTGRGRVGFTPLTDTELVELVLSDNAPSP
jgi:hypothetical protein